MKLYVANLHQIAQMETTLVGVFSSEAKAEHAGKAAIEEFNEGEAEFFDWDREGPELRYYYDGFTLMITEMTLDQPI